VELARLTIHEISATARRMLFVTMVDLRLLERGAMAETLKTVGTKIDALTSKLDAFSAAVDKRFEQVDKRFEQVDKRFEQVDKRFDNLKEELKGELGTKIEAVEAKVDLVLEGFENLVKKDAANSASHARMDARLDTHEIRIAALENQPS
jgi:chaperonin cofactor prefoldin